MSLDVTPNLKTNVGSCGCGCELYGTLRAKPWRDGVVCVRRGCTCPRCRGKRNRAKGDSKARKARQVLGLTGVNTRHEELWGGPLRTEAKAGGKASTVRTAYEASRAQSDAAKPLGDTRPFVASFAPDNTGHVYFVVRADDLERVVFALAEQWSAAS